MADDLVERLRRFADAEDSGGCCDLQLLGSPSREAADEIERLRRALHDVIACDHHNHYDGPTARYVQVARAALSKTEPTN